MLQRPLCHIYQRGTFEKHFQKSEKGRTEHVFNEKSSGTEIRKNPEVLKK